LQKILSWNAFAFFNSLPKRVFRIGKLDWLVVVSDSKTQKKFGKKDFECGKVPSSNPSLNMESML
jgi:hypothetical protein